MFSWKRQRQIKPNVHWLCLPFETHTTSCAAGYCDDDGASVGCDDEVDERDREVM